LETVLFSFDILLSGLEELKLAFGLGKTLVKTFSQVMFLFGVVVNTRNF
jgi:hypothetical protein